MSYTPTNWQTGDTITAPLLNKMEQGIASAGGGNVEIVHFTCEGSVGTATCDKTFSEIEALAQSGKDLLAEISIEVTGDSDPIYGKVISALTYFPAEDQDPAAINTYPVCFFCESNVCYVQVIWEFGEDPSYSAGVAYNG